MNKLGRAPFYAIWFYIIFCSFITWQEYFTPISSSDYKVLVVARVLLFGSAIPVSYILRKNPFSLWALNSTLKRNALMDKKPRVGVILV